MTEILVLGIDESDNTAMVKYNGRLEDKKLYSVKRIMEADRQRDDIRAVLFCLCSYIVRPEYLPLMPEKLRAIIRDDMTDNQKKDNASIWLRYACDYFDMIPGDNITYVPVIKSLSNEVSTKTDLSELLMKAEVLVGGILGERMDSYFIEHKIARERLGRE